MIQITPPQNSQYWINQRALTFSENDLENVDRIAVSLVSGTVIMVYEKGVIDYAPDGNFQKWTLKGYSTRLVSPLVHHIYARLSRTEKDALIVFSINNYNIDGSITTIVTDENGNPVLDSDGKEQTTTSEPNPNYWYVKIGEITATDGTSNRELTYDSGALGTKKGEAETGDWTDMFELSKQSTPWYIFVKQMFYEFTVKNPITLLSGLIFKNKKVTDIKRSTDSDHEYVLDDSGNPAIDEEGNQIKDPDYVPISDETIPTTAYLQKHGAQKYLSKIDNDTANGLITFLKGLVADGVIKAEAGATFGDTIDSMLAGKGTLITSDGRVQTGRMEVRGSALFREIVYNRLSAQEGDTSYSENGLVEEVTLESDGTYTLKLQKRWEGDFTAFKEGDILYGDVNNLFSTGEYYTSWVRVLSVNPTANTVSVVMYGDSEVPGGVNHAPEPLMRIVKRGNAIDTTRQSYWYLSATTERCFIWLEGVDKPMLDENNYYIMIGRPKNLSIFDNLPINYEHSYIYARGAIIQDLFRVDFQGVQVKTETPRGFWSLEVAQSDNPYLNTDDTYHTVSHYGCEWKCLVSGTLQEPKYGSSDWAMLRGNPEFTIEIDSTRGWFFDVETFSTTLFITGRLYNQDVTDSILDGDCSWTRDTGNVAEDNAWAVKRADAGKSIDLTLDDLGPNYPMLTGCKFKCTALLRDGQQVEIAENYVTF